MTSAAQVIEYPTSDGEPMAETGVHVLLMLTLIAALRYHFRARSDVYVIGNIYLYYEEGRPESRRSPDVMVVKGVPSTPERPSFKTWEEQAVPCVVFELTSKKTQEEDQGPKKELYQQLGVREYFLFDPLGDYLPRPLIGYRLIGGEYEELPPDGAGGAVSSELMIRLIPDGEQLRLIDYRTQQPIITPPEAYERLNAALQQIKEMQRAAEQAAERERLRIEQHRQQMEQQQREAGNAIEREKNQVERLRQQLEQYQREAEQRREAELQQRQEAVERERQQAELLEKQRQEAGERERQQAEQFRQQMGQQRRDAELAVERARQLAEEQRQEAERQHRLRTEELQRELARLRAKLPPNGGATD